jgi:hypothetical protein
MRSLHPVLFLLTVLTPFFGCTYKAEPANGKQGCAAGPKQCPDGYVCGLDNFCYHSGVPLPQGGSAGGPAGINGAGGFVGGGGLIIGASAVGGMVTKIGTGGTGWTGVGAGTGEIAPTRASSGKIAVSNGVPYAAFSDSVAGGRLSVMKYSGSSWVNVGNPGFTTSSVYSFVLFVDQGTPYVAFTGSSSNLSVMKFNGASWVNVGGTIGNSYSYYSSSFDFIVSGGVPYIAFSDSSGQLHVQHLSGTAWVDLGGTYVSSDGQYPALTVYNGQVTVVFSDSSGSNYNVLTVKSFNLTVWVTLISTTSWTIGSSYGETTTVTVSNGILYIIFYSSTYGPVVLQLNGGSLVSVGTVGSISNGDDVEYVSGVVYNGVPYVAFDDESRDSDPEPKAATVKYFDGTSWQLYAGYPDTCDIENTYLAVDHANGSLYFTYTDCAYAMTVQIH